MTGNSLALSFDLIAASLQKKSDMAVCMLVSVKSVIKGYHMYRVSYPSGTELVCNLEPENEHSDSAIIVKKGNITVGHIPEGLSQPLTQLFQDGNIVDIECVITGEPRSAEEGTFVQGGGLEIPCTYRLFGLREKKVHVHSVIKKQIRKLTA